MDKVCWSHKEDEEEEGGKGRKGEDSEGIKVGVGFFGGKEGGFKKGVRVGKC